MNTRQAINDAAGPQSLSVQFNQDCDCFAVGLDTGFCVFNSEPCELKVSRDFNAGIGLVEMLGRANYLALVGGGKQPKYPPNKVIIWDDSKQKAVITLEFRAEVRRVRLSRSRIVVALQNSVHVYAFSSPPKQISEFETADNFLGLCCLAPKVIAFPGRTAGQVQLVETASGNVSIIPAHVAPLRAMDLSADGETLATASETGTLIKLFSTSNCSRLAELRRGVEHATILSIKMSPAADLLAVTSDKATLHIFDVPKSTGTGSGPYGQSSSASLQLNSGISANQKWGLVGKIPFLPRVFSDEYSFASAAFELGVNSNLYRPVQTANSRSSAGEVRGLPMRGVLAWLDESTIIVLSAGPDGRWEKFMLGAGEDGKRFCARQGWKRYLGP